MKHWLWLLMFQGLYCFCDGTYEEDQTMIQCVMCQDWFHDFCIKKEFTEALPIEEDTEYVCRNCTKRYRFFITKYPHLKWNATKSDTVPAQAEDKAINVTEASTDEERCLVEGTPEGQVEDLFLAVDWKDKLCRCQRCMATYLYAGVTWIVEKENKELEENEEEGDPETRPEEGGQLPTLDFSQQMQIHHGMNELGSKLKDYLASLTQGDASRVIEKRVFCSLWCHLTLQDIEAFFAGLKEEAETQAAKRRRFGF